MNNVPKKLRDALANDPYYKRCARPTGCSGRITWEHAFTYAGKQIQERWAIIPLCWHHHLGEGLKKSENIKIAMSRATDADRKKYPRINWRQYQT